jgi:hypothetical protein
MSDGVNFLAVSLADGHVLCELPDLQVSEMIIRLEEASSTSATLSLRNAPVNWEPATRAYCCAVLAVTDSMLPLWGGIVVKRSRELGAGVVTLTLETVETYLSRLYMPAVSFSKQQQSEIFRQLVDLCMSGHDFNYALDIEDSAVIRDRQYTADNKTLLSALQDLGSVINGIEWESYWRADGDGSFTPVFHCADRLGGTMPMHVALSQLAAATYLEDYSSSYGANRVQAVSGSGDTALRSSWHQVEQPSRPVVDYIYSANDSVVVQDTLEGYAAQNLKALQDGTNTLTVGLPLLDSLSFWTLIRMGDSLVIDFDDDNVCFPDVREYAARIIGAKYSFGQGGWLIEPTLQKMEE